MGHRTDDFPEQRLLHSLPENQVKIVGRGVMIVVIQPAGIHKVGTRGTQFPGAPVHVLRKGFHAAVQMNGDGIGRIIARREKKAVHQFTHGDLVSRLDAAHGCAGFCDKDSVGYGDHIVHIAVLQRKKRCHDLCDAGGVHTGKQIPSAQHRVFRIIEQTAGLAGKSFIRKPLDLLLTPINEQDAIEREKEQAYKEKLRASKNSKNQPEDPHACPRNNGVAISIAKLLQLLTYAEGKHLIGIGEEMDTLVKTERAGVWSQKSDIYRLAFDNGIYGQAYMSDASFNAHVKVYYNLLLTGTPNSLKRFFKDPEDGLITRVCFAQLPDTSFTEIPAFASYTEAEKAEIIRWARQLDAIGRSSSISSELNSDNKGLVHISCPQLDTVISDWLERKRQQSIDADSHAMDTLRRRAAVIGFRAGMLCYLLENHKYTKTVGAFAEWVAEYIFRNQMELWGQQIEQTFKSSIESQTERGAAASLISLLPDEFTAADLIKLRARKGQSVKSSAISMVINRWRANNRIEKATETTWRKL